MLVCVERVAGRGYQQQCLCPQSGSTYSLRSTSIYTSQRVGTDLSRPSGDKQCQSRQVNIFFTSFSVAAWSLASPLHAADAAAHSGSALNRTGLSMD